MSEIRTVKELKEKLESFEDNQIVRVTMENFEIMEDQDIADVLIGVYDECLISINADRLLGKFEKAVE